MIKKLKLLLFLGGAFSLFTIKANAQLKEGQLIDGIAAVVGNEIVLKSDIEEQENYAKQQGAGSASRCEFLESVINNKLLIHNAKQDTLIENKSKQIKDAVGEKYNRMIRQFPSEKDMLEAYKFRSSYEMKNAIERIDTDNYYGQTKFGKITEKTDVTPNEVTDFFNTYKTQLPEVKEEVVLSQIAIYPKLTDAHKDEITNKLKKIKQDILNGESFETQARIYSEDEGSASNGGLFKNVSKGAMVKPFEAAALNLEENEISDPVESEFGFHLIQLLKKTGKLYDVRHILIKTTPNTQEIAAAKKELNDIRTQILEGKISFKEAALKYSDDKNTKFNSGTLTSENGSDRIEKTSLSPVLSYQVAGLNKGDLTDVFQDELERKKAVAILRIEDVISAHRLSLVTDYERIKLLALNKKKNGIVEEWVKKKLPETFVSIDKNYKDCHFKMNWNKTQR